MIFRHSFRYVLREPESKLIWKTKKRKNCDFQLVDFGEILLGSLRKYRQSSEYQPYIGEEITLREGQTQISISTLFLLFSHLEKWKKIYFYFLKIYFN
jgi:hypothetical protein